MIDCKPARRWHKYPKKFTHRRTQVAKNSDKSTKIENVYGEVKNSYHQNSVKKRIEALFLDNLGQILTREQIIQVAVDPKTGKQPENCHQRLSELRTDDGYTILSWRNKGYLKVEEYLMPHAEKRDTIAKRIKPTDKTWLKVLKRADYACEWNEDGQLCGLSEGDTDPIGGGRVKLTPDHKTPHSINPNADKNEPNQWQVLCGRHQVMKKNYWDNNSGKMNVYAIVQAATKKQKAEIFKFLLEYFGYRLNKDKTIDKIS